MRSNRDVSSTYLRALWSITVMARACQTSGKLGHFLRACGETRIATIPSSGVPSTSSHLELDLAGMTKCRLEPVLVKPHRISADKNPLSKAVNESSGMDVNSAFA